MAEKHLKRGYTKICDPNTLKRTFWLHSLEFRVGAVGIGDFLVI